MDYHSAIAYLETLQSTKIELGLERIRAVCKALSNPERKFPSVIIAGTNGKGSTAAFLESLFRHGGLKVGLFTSPHLVDVRERIQIDRKLISEVDFTSLVERLKLLEQFNLTYFEFLTVMGFVYFAEQGVDIAILEVGLGGRIDSTNIVTPLVSIITRIGIDHQDYLGTTIDKIAFEKCGIIKEGVPVVTVDQDLKVMEVIRRVADERKTVVHMVSPYEVMWPLGLSGRHQLENAASALRAAEIVMEIEPSLSRKIPIAEALKSTRWSGRLETISKDPLIILDGAHNPNGAEILAHYIKETYPKHHKIIIIGVMADKDMEGIIRPLIKVTDRWVATRPSTKRAADPNKIAGIITSLKGQCNEIEPLESAINQTIEDAPPNSVIIITGSLYMVGEVKKIKRFA